MAQDFSIFTEAKFPSNKKMPVAIRLSSQEITKVFISLIDKEERIYGFTESSTDENGFACLTILTPQEEGNYTLKISINKEKKFKTQTLPIKIIHPLKISLNAIPVNEKDHFYIYLLGDLKKGDKPLNAKCSIKLSSKNNDLYSKTIFPDDKGKIFWKIPLTDKKADYLLNFKTNNYNKTLAVRTDFEHISTNKQDHFYVNLLPQSPLLAEGISNRFKIIVENSDNKATSQPLTISAKNFNCLLTPDEMGHAFFDFEPKGKEQSFDVYFKLPDGKEIFKKFTFPVSDTNLYISSDNFTVNQGEDITFKIQSRENKNILLLLKSNNEVIDYFNILLADKKADLNLNTEKLKGVYSLETHDGTILNNFVVFPEKKVLNFEGLQQSYISGQPLNIKINSTNKNIFSLFSLKTIKTIVPFINLINKPSENLLNLSAYIDESSAFDYGRIFFYPENIDITQFTIPQLSSENNEILNCTALIDNTLSFNVPFDFFKGFISFFDIESETIHSEPFYVKNDFSLSLPALDYGEFTQGDLLKFPIKFTNHTDLKGKIEMTFAERDSFKINGGFKQILSLEPDQKGYAYYDIIFNEPSLAIKIALGANFYNSYKEIRGNIQVKPKGYREDTCNSFILTSDIKIPSGKQRTLYVYNSVHALAEDTLSSLQNKPCFSSFNLIGQKLIANEFEIKTDNLDNVNDFLNENGISLYRYKQNPDPFLTYFAIYAFPDKLKHYHNFKIVEKPNQDKIKELLIYYFLKKSELKPPAILKSKDNNEVVNHCLELYLTDSFSEKNVQACLSKISSVGNKNFFHTSNSVFSDYDVSLSDIEATSLITCLLPIEYISIETKNKILNFLIESRLPDKTWGNSITSWIALSAIKKLIPEKPLSDEISVKGEILKEKLNFYDENSIRILPISTDEPIEISCNKDGFLGFLTSYSYAENLNPSRKMISMDFGKESFNKGDKLSLDLKWNFPDKRSPVIITITIPWGAIFSANSAKSLGEQNGVFDYIQTNNKLYLLANPEGNASLNLTALFPCCIYVDCAKIEGAQNSRITGTGIYRILEIK